MSIKRTIRQGQLISPFGVGSIMDIGPESFSVVDISRWNIDGLRTIEDSRLEDKLRRRIKAPKAKEGTKSVAIARFPRWHFCPRCRRMRRITAAEDEARGYPIPKCENPKCRSEMTPMGFVAVCSEGHLGDVDWYYWAHRASRSSKGVCSPNGAKLYFLTSGQGGGDWSAISVRCGHPDEPGSGCGATADFTGLVEAERPGGMRCMGRQPWRRDHEACDSPIRVFRRAASNLHFPAIVSAIDLAADSGATVDEHSLVEGWEGDPNIGAIRTIFAARQNDFEKAKPICARWIESFADRNGCGANAAADALRSLLEGVEAGQEAGVDDATQASFQQQILGEEWAVLAGARELNGRFLQVRPVVPPDGWPAELRRTVVGLSMVRRLREVRALLGFRRLSPGEDSRLVPVDLGRNDAGWYPGVEAWGEGIFLRLAEEEVRRWEEAVSGPSAGRLERLRSRALQMGWDESISTPRFLLLHSLAHAVVRRLSFDAGYSASSIRERIYSSSEGAGMCGILIYTADGDSEGSLGGLVRMGQPEKFGKLLSAALMDVSWCSADPVCRETEETGMDGLNAASCHACLLVSETSCSYNNSFLDRRALVEIGGGAPFFKLEGFSQGYADGGEG
jgi:hypothetical protein